jgi:hypothetical protein
MRSHGTRQEGIKNRKTKGWSKKIEKLKDGVYYLTGHNNMG